MAEIKGYQDQPDENISRVNQNKESEEQLLKLMETLENAGYDRRSLAIARTEFQTAFMWLNRAILQPKRLDGEK